MQGGNVTSRLTTGADISSKNSLCHSEITDWLIWKPWASLQVADSLSRGEGFREETHQ